LPCPFALVFLFSGGDTFYCARSLSSSPKFLFRSFRLLFPVPRASRLYPSLSFPSLPRNPGSPTFTLTPSSAQSPDYSSTSTSPPCFKNKRITIRLLFKQHFSIVSNSPDHLLPWSRILFLLRYIPSFYFFLRLSSSRFITRDDGNSSSFSSRCVQNRGITLFFFLPDSICLILLRTPYF